jgi:cytochrome oxidase Cu insertion factor (SCO1/SenC/PrrC family)
MSQGPSQKRSRLQLALIAVVFLGPLVVAAWLYNQGDSHAPSGRTNHGELLEPFVSVSDHLSALAAAGQQDRSWLLIYANDDRCEDSCRRALYTLRQARLMLGKEMDRVRRVFLHGDTLPDTVFLAEEHPGLITIEDSSLGGLLNNKRPAELPAGGYFLIDPLGNLVMYFQPDLDPAKMVDDIKHLLRLSRIG